MKVAISLPQAVAVCHRAAARRGPARGHEVQVIDYLRCYMNISAVRPTILYRGEALPEFDAVIPRIGASHTVYGTAVVRQFEILGVATANGSDAISRATTSCVRCNCWPPRVSVCPSTGFAHSSRDLAGLLAGIGNAPVVVKLLGGMPGTGAILAETNAAAASVIEAFSGLDAESLVQEFIAEAAGTSLRCLVVGQARGGGDASLGSAGRISLELAPRRRCPAGAPDAGRAQGRGARRASRWGWPWRASTVGRRSRGPLVTAVNASPELERVERRNRHRRGRQDL